MEFITLTKTDLQISRLGFGCEPLGGTDWGNVDRELAMSAVSKAVDLGINYFDTADVYGLGISEETLSRALGNRRHDVVIATKFGVNWKQVSDGKRAKTFIDASPSRVVEAVENSLRRLRLDTLPLYYVHWPDPNTPLYDTLDALLRCAETGKIKFIGVSNFPKELILEASKIVDLAAVQVQYNLIDRQVEKDILPLCKELNISVLAYGSLAQGLLSGKYRTHTSFGKNDRRHRLPHFHGKKFEENLETIRRLENVGVKYRKSPAQTAIRWLLENPILSCAIVGIKTPHQIEHNFQALDWSMDYLDYEYLSSESRDN